MAIAALLGAFVATARGGLAPASADTDLSMRCELNPPHDAAGLDTCLSLNPRDVELMLDLAAVYEAERRDDHAEAIYRQALAVDEKDGDVHVRLGTLLLRRGDHAGAAAEARIALAFQPGTERATSLLAHAERTGDP